MPTKTADEREVIGKGLIITFLVVIIGSLVLMPLCSAVEGTPIGKMVTNFFVGLSKVKP